MTTYNSTISYEVVENGYKIYKNGTLWITQLGDYGKPIDSSKTYEENCIAQLDEITAEADTTDIEEMQAAISENTDAIAELGDTVADLSTKVNS